MKKSKYLTKQLAFSIIILFITTSLVPCTAKDSINSKELKIDYSGNKGFVDGEFFVKFSSDITLDLSKSKDGLIKTGIISIDNLNEKHSVTSAEKMFNFCRNNKPENPYIYNIYKFYVPKTSDILSIVKEYSQISSIIYAEPNYIFHSTETPNDPYLSLQWALHNTGQTGGTNDADIDAIEAWDIETGDEDIIICVLDTGVDWDHPDLEANIWINPGEDINGNGIADPTDFNDVDDDENGFIDDIRGWDFVDTNDTVYPGEDGKVRDNDPMDFWGHGTHCSGIASSVTNNNVGVAGVCWNCSIMAVRAGYMTEGGHGLSEEDDVADGIIYTADNGADVLSMSWGSYNESDLLKDLMDYTYSQGVVLVAGACNDDSNLKFYPASLDNVISVAATDHTDWKAMFSNHGSWVDVAAPGVDINSTFPDDTYYTWSGTSMSTPFVAGLASLILSKNPGFNQEEITTIIRSTTDSVNSSKYIGTGRINAYKAIQRDSTPIVILNSSLDESLVYNDVSVKGTATGDTFKNYSICYGLGVYPDEWTEIYTSTNPVTNDVLALWNVSNLIENKKYTLRLIVYNTVGQRSEDRAVLLIDSSPEKPKIEGPTLGKIKIKYDFFFKSIDNNDDNLSYYIDWGDGSLKKWFGPYKSGEEARINHTYTKTGDYEIKAKAKDIYGAESDWATFKLTIPRDRMTISSLFLQLLERYLNTFIIVKYLLGFN